MHRLSLDPETLLSAYAQGAFPMTDHDGVTRWYTADPRGVLPLDSFHIPKSLAQTYRSGKFEVVVNRSFDGTMRACMRAREDGTWISEELVSAYTHLHHLGHAHSVETWRKGELVGGLYGVSLGGAFFGESMFHTVRDASKIALVALVTRLRTRGFELLDAQATTGHLRRFGCVDIPATIYMERLRRAVKKQCAFV